MNHSPYLTIFLLMILGGSLSCSSVTDRPLPAHTPLLVMNGFFQPGQPLDVYLSRSYSTLDNPEPNDLLIDDASVRVRVAGGGDEQLTYRDTLLFAGSGSEQVLGKYFTPTFLAEAGKTYTMEVSHPSYPDISASTKIPLAASIVKAELLQNVSRIVTPFGGQSSPFQSILRITIDDPAGEKNYYQFEAQMWSRDTTISPEPSLRTLFLQGEALPGDQGTFIPGDQIIPDGESDGQQFTVDMLLELPNAYEPPSEIREYEVVALVLRTVSGNEQYGQYLNKLNAQQANAGGFNLFPSEAVIVPSNIENGYGILGAFTVSRDSLPQ